MWRPANPCRRNRPKHGAPPCENGGGVKAAPPSKVSTPWGESRPPQAHLVAGRHLELAPSSISVRDRGALRG